MSTDQWSQLWADASVDLLIVDWLPATVEMNSIQLVGSLLSSFGAAKKRHLSKVLLDEREFYFRSSNAEEQYLGNFLEPVRTAMHFSELNRLALLTRRPDSPTSVWARFLEEQSGVAFMQDSDWDRIMAWIRC